TVRAASRDQWLLTTNCNRHQLIHGSHYVDRINVQVWNFTDLGSSWLQICDAAAVIVATAPLTDNATFKLLDTGTVVEAPKEPQLETVSDLAQVQKLTAGWAGEGSVAPTMKTVSDARTFVSLLPEHIPSPTVSAAEDGEIVLEWWEDTRYIVASVRGTN